MGFNFWGFGAPCPCEISKGKVHWITPAGNHIYYDTTLQEDIPMQTNEFISRHVLFSLFKNGLQYVGLDNGAVQVYDVKTNLFMASKGFSPPANCPKAIVGYYSTGATGYASFIYMSLLDMQTIYSPHQNRWWKCTEKMVLPTSEEMARAEMQCNLNYNLNKPLVIAGGGKVYEFEDGTVPLSMRRRNCPIYL